MSEDAAGDQEGSSRWILWVILGIIGVLLIGVMALLMIPVIIASFADSGRQESSHHTCTTDGSSSSVEIPEEYLDEVEDAASASGLSPEIIAAQIAQESSWDPSAESPAGARGIAQFMPETWQEWGEGDIEDPEDSIRAQGEYMGYLMDHMEDHAEDEEHQVELALAGYNAGHGAVLSYGYDLDDMFEEVSETAHYVPTITSAAEGDYTADCRPGGGAVPEGDIVEASMALAHEEEVTLEYSASPRHGEDAAKEAFVDASQDLPNDVNTAYFTDCGVFVATAMRSSGADPEFQPRGTDAQLSYLQSSDKYEVFRPSSEGELEPGDVLIIPGHIYLYTGQRHSGEDGRAQGASLYTRPPSGHYFYLSDNRGDYYAARLKDGG